MNGDRRPDCICCAIIIKSIQPIKYAYFAVSGFLIEMRDVLLLYFLLMPSYEYVKICYAFVKKILLQPKKYDYKSVSRSHST